MSAMSSWNHHQVRVFQRYCSIYGVSLTPELAVHLATRYAEKHAGDRPHAERHRSGERHASAGRHVA
jgi:hypothetical protein